MSCTTEGGLISTYLLTLLGVGAIALIVDLAILMPLSKLYTGSTNEAGKAAAVSFIFIHSLIYSVFMFGTVWVYLSEIFPTKYRAQGSAICAFAGQAMGVNLQQVGLQIYDDIGYLFYIVFIVCTTLAGIVYFLYLPETKGMMLEDISAFFGDEVALPVDESKLDFERPMNEVSRHEGEEANTGVERRSATNKAELEEVERIL